MVPDKVDAKVIANDMKNVVRVRAAIERRSANNQDLGAGEGWTTSEFWNRPP